MPCFTQGMLSDMCNVFPLNPLDFNDVNERVITFVH